MHKTVSQHDFPISLIVRCAARPSQLSIFWMKYLNRIQLSVAEISLITNIVLEKRACQFLVFGLGNDSWYWHLLNRGGKTIFLEDNRLWLERITNRHPEIQVHLVDYHTRRRQWMDLLSDPARLTMPLPETVSGVGWDVILVDGPNGWRNSHPGRMKSIYMASKLTCPNGHIFIHDCNRTVEKTYSSTYLLNVNLSTRVGRLCHFHASSIHRTKSVLD